MQRHRVLAAALSFAGGGLALAASGVNLWMDVPYVRQQKQGCGDASVAMVIAYWQQQLHLPADVSTEAAAILRALPPGRHGVRASAMLGYFQQHNYRAFAYAGDWDDLRQQIAQGRPLIVAVKPRGDPDLHYVVVAGLDDPDDLVLLNDPAQRKLLKESRVQFEREWKATGNWTLLAVPHLK